MFLTAMTLRTPFLRVWGAPLLIAALTLFGLLAALLGTGAWHWMAWAALAVPVVVGLRFWVAPRG